MAQCSLLTKLTLQCVLNIFLLLASLGQAHISSPHMHSHAHIHDLKRSAQNTSQNDAFFRFITRPDIGALKWNIQLQDEEALAPGYWFISPYARLKQDTFPRWNGPHIYDQRGELIWSGSPQFKHYNTFDFKAVEVDGEQMLSLIFPHDHPGTPASITGMGFPPGQNGSGVVLNNGYEVCETVFMRGDLDRQNMHDLTLIEDGKRALILTAKPDEVERLHLQGEYSGPCKVGWQGFKEVEVKTGKTIYEWFAKGWIGVDESTKRGFDWARICRVEWDLLHFNSIDKFENGDYLVSARHTNTIYRVSPKDDSIVWRLGGSKSDFQFDDPRAVFTRQHHSKIYSENSTHTIITVFANNKGSGELPAEKGSQESSYGLVLALQTDTKPMTVDLVAVFAHPERNFTPSRGSMSILPNGNAFIGWSAASLISEHSSDGKLLMSAKLDLPNSDTYRAYKLPWTGRPSQPPDVHSLAIQSKADDDRVNTLVHVSWNGATEVAKWRLLHSDHEGENAEVVAEASRQGFETALSNAGFARFIIVVALDIDGEEIGRSKVVETIRSLEMDRSIAAAEEALWLQGDRTSIFTRNWWPQASIAFVLGVLACFMAGTIGFYLVRRGKTGSGQKRRPGWFNQIPRRRPARNGSNEEDLQQQEGLLKEHETEMDERLDSTKSRASTPRTPRQSFDGD